MNLKSWVSSAKLTKLVRSTLAELLVHFAPSGNQETGSDPGYGSDEEVESQVAKILKKNFIECSTGWPALVQTTLSPTTHKVKVP